MVADDKSAVFFIVFLSWVNISYSLLALKLFYLFLKLDISLNIHRSISVWFIVFCTVPFKSEDLCLPSIRTIISSNFFILLLSHVLHSFSGTHFKVLLEITSALHVLSFFLTLFPCLTFSTMFLLTFSVMPSKFIITSLNCYILFIF